MVSMAFDRGFEDPAVSMWMVMLGVQSLPYAATFFTATVSALSNQKQVARRRVARRCRNAGESRLIKAA